jgi:hypothetical protein
MIGDDGGAREQELPQAPDGREKKTAMSCGFMGLCHQNAVILRLCPSRPSAHEAERMDGAQHAECAKKNGDVLWIHGVMPSKCSDSAPLSRPPIRS